MENAQDRCDRRHGGDVLKSVMSNFAAASGLRFSLLDNNLEPQFLNSTILGKALGILNGLSVNTLVTPRVTSLTSSTKSLRLYIDQSTLVYKRLHYTNAGAWKKVQTVYHRHAVALVTKYATLIGVRIFVQAFIKRTGLMFRPSLSVQA